jgi:hypothetical protein
VRGTKHEFESTASDYRSVNGVKYPFAISIGEKGSPERQKIAIDKIKVNVPMEEALFKVPAGALPATTPAKAPGTDRTGSNVPATSDPPKE